MATGSSDNASWLPLSSGMPWLESPLLLPRRVSEIRLDGRDAIMEFPTRSKRERDAKKRRRAGRNETTTIGAGSATSGAGSTVGSKTERPILSETALDLVVSADCESALAYYASAALRVGKHWGKASAVPPPPAPLPPQQPGGDDATDSSRVRQANPSSGTSGRIRRQSGSGSNVWAPPEDVPLFDRHGNEAGGFAGGGNHMARFEGQRGGRTHSSSTSATARRRLQLLSAAASESPRAR